MALHGHADLGFEGARSPAQSKHGSSTVPESPSPPLSRSCTSKELRDAFVPKSQSARDTAIGSSQKPEELEYSYLLWEAKKQPCLS